jgi:uncharacterized protein (TIGR03067 family)
MSLSRTLLVLVVAGFAVPAFGQNQNNRAKNPDDKPGLDGTYVATSGEREGKPITEDQLKGVTFRFDGEKLTITDRTGKEIHKCTHTVDTAAKPWKITMKMTDSSNQEKTAVGLIEKSGDTVKFIYPLAGGETPTEFKTKDKQEMYVLKLQR